MSAIPRDEESPEQALLRRDAEVFLHQAGSTPLDKTFRAVAGAWAEDLAGHRFFDFHGNSCHNVGYGHPRLIAALKAQLDALPFTPRGFTDEPAVALAEKLVALWPYGPARVLLGLSGADAVEMALKLAFVATGRRKTLAFQDAWHGAALGALWVGGRTWQRAGFPAFEGCRHVPGYWAEPGPRACLEAIRDLLLGEGGFACLLAEPLKAAHRLPPDWFWPEVEAACRDSGTLLIFDEIPKGLGKTGRLFASEHFAVRPDMSVLGKSLGGAVVPLSAVIARDGLNVAGDRAIGHYTHQKNPLLARAGLTVLEILEEEGLCQAAERKGTLLRGKLAGLAGPGSPLAAVHGLGLLVAVELHDPSIGPALREACFRQGLHVGLSDGRHLELSPPLTISEEELDLALSMLASAMAEVTGAQPPA